MLLDLVELAGEGAALRPWCRGDAAVLVAAWSDPVILAGSGPEIVAADRSLAGAERWIDGCQIRATRGLALDLAIVDPLTAVVVGEVGISSVDQRRRAALLGWWAATEARGQGFAAAGVELFVSWLLTDGPLDAVVAEIGADNQPSIRVAQRAGLSCEQESGRGCERESEGTSPHERIHSASNPMNVFIRRRTPGQVRLNFHNQARAMGPRSW